MKIILFLIAGFQFLTINTFAQNDNVVSNEMSFKLYHEKPTFSIKFPNSYFLKENDEVKSLITKHYESTYNNEVFILKFIEHKNHAVSSDNTIFMNTSLDSFVKGIKGDLIERDEFKYNKIKGVEAFLSIKGKDLNVFYRDIIIDRVQYQIIVITKAKIKSTEADNFFDSFTSTHK